MANEIRIKRRAAGGAPGAPSSLANAELAFNEQDNVLYYGSGTGGAGGTASQIIAIGGPGAFLPLTATASAAQKLSTARTINGVSFDGTENITINAVDSTARIASTEKGAANGVATLGADGKVPSAQLPSYVDDVLEYATLTSFPATGSTSTIYIATDTNKIYRWSGTEYVEIATGSGIADTAAKLSTAQTISMTGDVTYTSAAFDGSASVTGTATLANSGVTAGTYGSSTSIPTVAVDAKGRVTSASNTDIQTASTSQSGIVQLSSAVDSTSTTLAATALAVKTAYDLAGAAIPASEKGVANGVATLGADSKIPASQLPSYVDDVVEYESFASLPTTGESAKIYVTQDTNKIYRWSGSAYIEISPVAGTVDTASKLATARTITIGSTGKSFDGSENVSWTLTEIGAAPDSHEHSASNITSGTLSTDRLPVPVSGTWFNGVPIISVAGVQEIGKTVDFHSTTDTTADYTFRLENTADGVLTASGSLEIGSGTVSAPGLRFSLDTNTGLYNTADKVFISCGGTNSVYFGTGEQYNYGDIYISTAEDVAADATNTVRDSGGLYLRSKYWNGSASANTDWSIVNDATAASATGNQLVFRVGGTNKMVLSNAGNISVTGSSTAWGTTSGTLTGGVNVVMGTGSSSTWLISGTSGGTFRSGVQSLDSNGSLRLYSNSSYVEVNGGTVIATDVNTTSDLRKKTNVTTAAADVIQQLRGVEFGWIANGEKSSGVIAQEVEEVIPHAVHTDTDGFKSVNYSSLIAYLIESVKSQQQQINELTMQLNELQAKN